MTVVTRCAHRMSSALASIAAPALDRRIPGKKILRIRNLRPQVNIPVDGDEHQEESVGVAFNCQDFTLGEPPSAWGPTCADVVQSPAKEGTALGIFQTAHRPE